MTRTTSGRDALLDAAERLIAEQGVGVSDRQIAEAAGNANHSAVGYHFGGRRGLLEALATRHEEELNRRRWEMWQGADSLLDDVRALVLPTVEVLAALPQPSWHARFADRVIREPGGVTLFTTSQGEDSPARVISESLGGRLRELGPEVVRARFALTSVMISDICARTERKAERDGTPADWPYAGDFLCDALAGMLAAPVTARGVPAIEIG